ncbi:iron-containing alcohol dehydrogenase [Chromobacterium sp. IIBBL 290-4]|uniref:iron-containing alcohol dehydrogenase n=1 Tax=Chromobacterium sp. IIBBL 290-4 TaxID=2953890 RepID=UPI0020B7A236|nr:iron-containing alcohol dehydrogenase [Chromobacterium sp. IIBBL 290-4]UTH73124.1 iron-containing alcohol dehydrogenase [Chromobacterium sp. IIBBL 290-4]
MRESILEFDHQSLTAIRFGAGKLEQLASLLPRDAKVLLLYGGGSIKRNGVYDQLAMALAGWDWLEFGGVPANPEIEVLDQAKALIRAEGRDFILAVGGGSVIDAAKYLAAAAPYPGEGWDLVCGKVQARQALAIGAVLTLAATGSEANGTAVISRASTQDKLTFRSPLLRPCFAILDPEVLASLPERQLANGVADAFVHACEQYLTYPVGALVQDGCAEGVLRALYQLACRFDERASLWWRQNLMWAANQALSVTLGLGVPHDWATHRIGRTLTALHGIDHGRTLTIVQPSLLREALREKGDKLRQMGRLVFEAPGISAEGVIERIEAMYLRLGMPLRLREAVPDAPQDAAMSALALLRRDGPIRLGEDGIFDEARVERIVRACCR